MTKKIKKLEKETIIWRTKWENNNKALLQMAEEVRGFPRLPCVMGTPEVQALNRAGDGSCDTTAIAEDSGQSWGRGIAKETLAFLAVSCIDGAGSLLRCPGSCYPGMCWRWL